MAPQERSDAELVALVVSGQADAYRTLVERYFQRVYAFACRLATSAADAEEITQETFLRLWQQADRYRPQAALVTWLYRIARNLTLDRLRRRREVLGASGPTEDDDGSPDAPESSSAPRPSALLERKETILTVMHAVQALPERQKTAVLLTHYEGLSNEQAAQVLQVSVHAFESLLARARRELRSTLVTAMSPGEQPA